MKKKYQSPKTLVTRTSCQAIICASKGAQVFDNKSASSGATVETKDRGDYDEGNGWGNGLW